MAWKLPEVITNIVENSTRFTKGFAELWAKEEGEEVESYVESGVGLPASVVNGSPTADYVVAEVDGALVATPKTGSALPMHTGTTEEVGTVINAAITTLKGAGHIHLALGSVSTNDAEIVIQEGLNKSSPFSSRTKLIITGDGATQLNQTAPGKNTLKVENASTVDLSGFRLYSGPESGSALFLSDEGTESAISAIESRIELHCESASTSAPAVLIRNPAYCTFPMLQALSTGNHGLVIENTSTTINYGNSTFGLVYTYAKKEAPYAGLGIITTHHQKFPDLMTFDFLSCVNSGYYGLYTLGARYTTFKRVDLEGMVAPVWHDGNSEGAETKGVHILSGYLKPTETTTAAVTNTQYTAGNSCTSTVEGAAEAIPLKDEVTTGSGRALNRYDLTLENSTMASYVSVANTATLVTLRLPNQGVVAPIGTNRPKRVFTASHTIESKDMGLALEYNSSSAGIFTIAPFSEKALPVGTTVRLYQMGTGQLTVAAGTGVTLRNPLAYAFAQYEEAELRCRAENEWVLAPLGGAEGKEGKEPKPGAWEKQTLSSKLEIPSGQPEVEARLEQGGTVVRLRGVCKVKSGEELKAGETVFTLPADMWPAVAEELSLLGGVILKINPTNGVVTLGSAKAAGSTIGLAGLTFSTT